MTRKIVIINGIVGGLFLFAFVAVHFAGPLGITALESVWSANLVDFLMFLTFIFLAFGVFLPIAFTSSYTEPPKNNLEQKLSENGFAFFGFTEKQKNALDKSGFTDTFLIKEKK